MSVLLIEPPEQYPTRARLYPIVLPRGLLITASALEAAGYDARVVDLRGLNVEPKSIKELYDGVRPTLVGVSVHGVPNLRSASSCIQWLDGHWPDIPIVVGGFLAKAVPHYVKCHLPANVEVFAEDSDAGQEKTLTIANLHGNPVVQPVEQLPTAKSRSYQVPTINYKLLLSAPKERPLAAYMEPDFEFHLETQRGCPYRCSYCGTFPRGKGNMLFRKPSLVVDEIEAFFAECRSQGFESPPVWITDETFTDNLAHAAAFCDELLKRALIVRWRAQTRADKVDAEVFHLMKRAGCYEISFGIESFAPTVLERVRKGIHADAELEAIRIAREAGLKVRAIIIVGLPGDNEQTIRQTFRRLADAQPNSVQTYIFHPVPGSPEWERQPAKASLTIPLDGRRHLGFLEAPDGNLSGMSRESAIRYFVMSNYLFPSRVSPCGDARQLSNVINAYRPSTGTALDIAQALDSIRFRKALSEIFIASTAEFTREELEHRVIAVSGCCADEIAPLFNADRDTLLNQLTSGFTPIDGCWYPKLVGGVVLTRTGTGGLLTDARLSDAYPVDDLLRRTFLLRSDAYEALLRCIGLWTREDICDAVSLVCGNVDGRHEAIMTFFEDMKAQGFLM